MNATLRKMRTTDFDALVTMYETFEPKAQFQGLPPSESFSIRRWLHRLGQTGVVQFVIEVAGDIVGHAMLCPSEAGTDAELAIFVHQDYRGLGLGRKLLLGALNHGCKVMELGRVWLSTQGSNTVALRLFETVGFRSRGASWPWWWELELERPSHCAACKGELCEVYRQPLPVTVALSEHQTTSEPQLIKP